MTWSATFQVNVTVGSQNIKYNTINMSYVRITGNPNKRMVLQEMCMSHETDLELTFKTRRCVAVPYEALKLYFSIGNIDILDQIVFTARVRKLKK